MGTEPLVYTPAQIQQLLGLSKNSVYQRIADGSLPAVRLGRRLVIPRAALEKLLEQAVVPFAGKEVSV